MNELELTADIASWINEILLKLPSLPFARAKCEQTGRGSRKRRDLTLLDKGKRGVLTGEVKLPYQSGLRGLVRVPHEEDECLRVHREYADFVFKRNRQIVELIEERTKDEDLREKIFEELIPRFCRY
ncbi:MAG: hypothetical protein LDL33_02490 [Desulfomonile sp.]|nr:hypothetical protein [Desulfomonile sp.]